MLIKTRIIDFKKRIFADKKELRQNILYVLGLVLFSIFFLWFISISDSAKIQELVERGGIWGPIAFFIYMIFSEVVAPVSGTPAVLISFTLFGVLPTLLLSYFAGLISAVINFYISRLFGRRIVVKLTGERMMKEIDSYVEVSGSNMLILARIMGFPFYEFISYAAGLTSISFKKYFTITALASIVPAFFFALFYKFSVLLSLQNDLFWGAFLIAWGIIFAILFRRIIVRTKKKMREEESENKMANVIVS